MSKTTMTPSPLVNSHWSSDLRVTRWILAVLGAISAFMGLFILFGGEDQYVGLGGEASWRVGDIDPLWAYGLLIGGLVLLVVGGYAVARYHAAVRAGTRPATTPRSDLISHAIVFVIVNAFIWAQDIALGDGVNYAWWITVPWAVGLLAHGYAYLADHRHVTR